MDRASTGEPGAGATLPATLSMRADDLVMRPPSGSREAALFDAVSTSASWSDKVTAVLTAGFEPRVAGSDLAGLASVERQVALFRLALSLGTWPTWFVSACRGCGELIDVRVARDEFEFAPAERTAPGFPILDVVGPGDEARPFMVPSGHHEALIARLDPSEAAAALVALCDRGSPTLDADVRAGWVTALDVALESVSSRFDPELTFACPHCAAPTGFWFDPLDWIARHAGQAFRDVHMLARAYGWAEDAILAMSTARRQTYLSLLEAD